MKGCEAEGGEGVMNNDGSDDDVFCHTVPLGGQICIKGPALIRKDTSEVRGVDFADCCLFCYFGISSRDIHTAGSRFGNDLPSLPNGSANGLYVRAVEVISEERQAKEQSCYAKLLN